MPSKAFSQANLLGTDNTLQATSLSTDIPITELYANIDELPASGTLGEQAFVQSTNRLYIWNGSGWYNIALINTTPTWDSGGQPAASYELDADSPQSSVTITLSASDPEGIPITYSYITSGQMDSMSTISQDSSIFTISPKTVTEVGEGVELTGSITFRASDGINILPQVSSFTLSFIGIIENSRYTTLLITVTGASDNNNITDASSNNHTITVNGNAHAGTFSPYRSGGYSLEFNGSNSRVGIQSSNVQIGTSAFTMEFWLYSRAHSGSISSKYSSSNSNGYFLISTTSSEGFRCRTRSSGGTQKYVNSGSGSYNLNQWNHCIFQRDANGNLTSYLNGTKYTGENDGSTNLSATELGLGVFNYIGYEGWLDGYIRDFKLTIGTSALRTASTITVPTEPLASDSNTTAFLGHLPYFGDGSSSPNTVVSSNASTAPFSPHDYEKYDAADHGGSVYTSGTESLGVSSFSSFSNIGTGDYTLECWHYNDTANSGVGLDFRDAAGIALVSSSGSLRAYYVTGTIFASTAIGVITPRQWNHLVFCRISGILKGYLNGKEVFSVNDTTNLSGSSNTVYIGNNAAASSALNGYYSSVRMTNKGVYTGEFTPPTTPLSTTQSSGTNISAVASGECKLLVKGTDASIIDKSQINHLKIHGNTTGSTGQAKFASTKSMYFDGSGDYAQLPVGSLHLGSSDFTIETWIYQDTNAGSGGSSHTIYSDWINTNNDKSILLRITDSSGQKVQLLYSTDGTTNIIHTSTSSISNSTWIHVAVCKDSTSLRLYIDGVEEIWENNPSFTLNSNAGTIGPLIGGNYDEALTSYGQFFDGYIQDFRITKGLARYTANFTPPTAELEG
jgi:hypothetical protein